MRNITLCNVLGNLFVSFGSGSQTSQLEASDCKIEDFRQTASRHIREDLNLHLQHAGSSVAASNILSFMQSEVTSVLSQGLGTEWLADSVLSCPHLYTLFLKIDSKAVFPLHICFPRGHFSNMIIFNVAWVPRCGGWDF